MQLNHEVRARKLGLAYDLIDLRTVYAHHKGLCGICHQPVSIDTFTIDHIVPVSRGGPHLFENLQPAHLACNVKKGDQ
jgi:5-methylcytosine-specific restriction endonuclease McrA